MTITAKISSGEVTRQVTDRYVDEYFEIALFNAPGVSYNPGVTTDSSWMANEVALGTGGYDRQIIKYVIADVANYSDFGVGLAQKAAVFSQDGGGTAIEFTHVGMLEGRGNVVTLGSTVTQPASWTDGTYTAVPTTTFGSGLGCTLDITVTGGSASFAINNAGRGYTTSDVLVVDSTVLNAIGASAESTELRLNIAGATATGADAIVSVAQTSSPVSLIAGNQAVFYYNIKQFGYYSSSS